MKYYLSLFLLSAFLLVVIVYGLTGTGAWFTAQAVIDNNVISTGNLDLVINNVSKASPPLEPGGDYKEILRFCAKNGGSYPLKWHGGFSGVQAPAGMAEKILVKAVVNPTGLAGNYGPANATRFENVPAAELMVENKHLLVSAEVYPEPFKPNDVICYSIQAKLLGSAGNAYKAKTFTAQVQLDATQWNNPDWKE
jgi:hypothetical protein